MTSENMPDEAPIRVLVISQLFPPESMAGSHRWQKIIEHLPDGFDCRVVCPHPTVPVGTFERSSSLWKTEEIEEIPVTRLWTYQPVEDRSTIERILNYIFFSILASIYILLRFRRYDCVIAQIGPHTTLLPGIIAKCLGCKLVVDIDDLWLDNAAEFGFIDQDTHIYRFIAQIEKFAFKLADHIIVLTPTMAQYYQDKYHMSDNAFTSIPFGVSESLFDVDSDQYDASSEYDHERVIYTGKLGEGQAFEPFLRAFRDLKADVEHDVLIVGFGERKAELKQRCEQLGIADRVEFRDPVPREEIPELLASSVLSWVPLKTEHQLDYARPTKLLETMAVGTPYIASRVTEISIVAEESQSGIAVDNESDSIQKAMRVLLSDPEQREEMGKRGVSFIDKHHRWDALGEKTGDVLSTVMRRTET